MDGYVLWNYDDIMQKPIQGERMRIPVDVSKSQLALFRHADVMGSTVLAPIKTMFMRTHLARTSEGSIEITISATQWRRQRRHAQLLQRRQLLHQRNGQLRRGEFSAAITRSRGVVPTSKIGRVYRVAKSRPEFSSSLKEPSCWSWKSCLEGEETTQSGHA